MVLQLAAALLVQETERALLGAVSLTAVRCMRTKPWGDTFALFTAKLSLLWARGCAQALYPRDLRSHTQLVLPLGFSSFLKIEWSICKILQKGNCGQKGSLDIKHASPEPWQLALRRVKALPLLKSTFTSVRCFAAPNMQALLYVTLVSPLGLKYNLVCSLLKCFTKEDVSLVIMCRIDV